VMNLSSVPATNFVLFASFTGQTFTHLLQPMHLSLSTVIISSIVSLCLKSFFHRYKSII